MWGGMSLLGDPVSEFRLGRERDKEREKKCKDTKRAEQENKSGVVRHEGIMWNSIQYGRGRGGVCSVCASP